jgi:hypothetical protein
MILLWPGSTRATSLSIRPLSISELVMRADVIALATVNAITSDWSLNRTTIETRIDLKVEEVFKGTAAQDRIIFYQLGGLVGETASVVGETAQFVERERVTVFLAKNSRQRLELVGSFQGKFLIQRRPEGEVAVRRVPGLGKPLDEIPLDDFKMQIQKALTK